MVVNSTILSYSVNTDIEGYWGSKTYHAALSEEAPMRRERMKVPECREGES